MTAKVNDRRRAPRAPVLLSVHYETVASAEDAKTVDISRSGLFLGTNAPLPVGTELELRIGDTSKLKVRVARVVEPDAAGHRTPGMGCAILEADEAARLALAGELARTPIREMRIVVDGPWPAPVPLAPKHAATSAIAAAAAAAAKPTSSSSTKSAERKNNGAATASVPASVVASVAADHPSAAPSVQPAPEVVAATGDKKTKKDKKRQKGAKADLFLEKPE